MTHQTPTRAQAEAWGKNNLHPVHWNHKHPLDAVTDCNCGRCDAIRRDMLSYDNHIADATI